jgi:hypothetical protein
MEKRRSKKRNYLTKDEELVELAYRLHFNAIKLRETVTHINITAEFRMRLLRGIQSDINLAKSLGVELSRPDENALLTIGDIEKKAEELGLFD